MQLRINLREVQDVTCIDLSGKILLGEESEVLRQQIKQLVSAQARRVLLNLTEVSYLDSTGVGTVIEAFLAVKQAGGRMALLIPPGPGEKVTRVFGPLADASFRSEPEALASLK